MLIFTRGISLNKYFYIKIIKEITTTHRKNMFSIVHFVSLFEMKIILFRTQTNLNKVEIPAKLYCT